MGFCIFTICIATLFWYIVVQFNTIKENRRSLFYLYIIVIILVRVISQSIAMNNSLDNSLINVLIKGFTIPVTILTVYFFNSNFVRITLSVAVADGILVVVEATESILYLLLYKKEEISFTRENDIFVQVILFLIIAFFICILPTKFYRKARTFPIEKYFLAKLFAVLYWIIGLSPLVSEFYFKTNLHNLFYVFCFASINILLVLFLFLHNENKLSNQKNKYLSLQETLLKEHCKMLEEQVELTRHFRHDIRKHLEIVNYLLPKCTNPKIEEEVEEYKHNLNELYQKLVEGDYCNQVEINAMLYQLENYCKQQKIPLFISLKTMQCEYLSKENRLKVFRQVVDWIIRECNLCQKKEPVKIEVKGETAMGKSIFTISAVSDEFAKGEKKKIFRQKDNLAEVKKIIKEHNGIVEVKNKMGMRALILSWEEEHLIF